MNTTEIKTTVKTEMTENERKEAIKVVETLLPKYEENIEKMFERIWMMVENKERKEVIDLYYDLLKSQVHQYIQLQDDYQFLNNN